MPGQQHQPPRSNSNSRKAWNSLARPRSQISPGLTLEVGGREGPSKVIERLIDWILRPCPNTSGDAHRLRSKGGRTAGRIAQGSKGHASNRHPWRFLSCPLRLRLPSNAALDGHRPAAALCSCPSGGPLNSVATEPGGLVCGQSKLVGLAGETRKNKEKPQDPPPGNGMKSPAFLPRRSRPSRGLCRWTAPPGKEGYGPVFLSFKKPEPKPPKNGGLLDYAAFSSPKAT